MCAVVWWKHGRSTRQLLPVVGCMSKELIWRALVIFGTLLHLIRDENCATVCPRRRFDILMNTRRRSLNGKALVKQICLGAMKLIGSNLHLAVFAREGLKAQGHLVDGVGAVLNIVEIERYLLYIFEFLVFILFAVERHLSIQDGRDDSR